MLVLGELPTMMEGQGIARYGVTRDAAPSEVIALGDHLALSILCKLTGPA